MQSRVHSVMELADKIHINDKRKKDGSPYIHHQIRIILSYIEKYKRITPHRTIVLMLHDAIEDHPESWREIYDLIWVHIFRDVLILATWGLPIHYRTEMEDFFNHKFPNWNKLSNKGSKPGAHIVSDIMKILSTKEPLVKLENESQYSKIHDPQDSQKLEYAIRLYKDFIISPGNEWLDVEENKEYIGLGNYLYFTNENAHDKLQDMIENVSDLEEMEKQKPWYTQKRRVKAYILWVKFKNYGMVSEYDELEQALQSKGTSMLTDTEVIRMLSVLEDYKKILVDIHHAKNTPSRANLDIGSLNHEAIHVYMELKNLKFYRKCHELKAFYKGISNISLDHDYLENSERH